MRAAAVALLAFAALAAPAGADTSPYRGMETREIKALSAQEVADLEAGNGMSLALAAELNGFPGPRHVLDLAEPLGLSEAQRAAIAALFEAMRTEAVALGTAVVAREAELEQGFRTASLDERSLGAKVMEIAELRGRLRTAHLRQHLATRDLLDRHQRVLYDRLRGYGDAGGGHGQHRHRH